MKISVIQKEELKHEYKVTVPAKAIDDQLTARLMELAKTVNLPGFRPGKVPMDVMRQKYGQRVMGEVLERTVQETSQKALDDKKIVPAMQPRINVTKFDDGADLEYNLTVEIMPKFKMIDFAKLKLERPVADVTQEEVDKALDRFSKQFKDSAPIKEKRAAKEGDTVMVDFVGRLDGEEFPGGAGKDTKLELGSGYFLAGFEKGVVGMKAGETKKVPVDFPENYGSADLAGKTAEFEITLNEIHKVIDPKLNDELAKKAGFDDLKALKEAIENQITSEFQGASRIRLKRNLLDALAGEYSFDIPEGLYQQEYDTIVAQFKQSQGHADSGSAEQDNSESGASLDDKTKKDLKEIAERRVRLGIVLAEVGRENKIQVNDDELRQAVLREAQNYPGQEQKVIEYFQQNPQAVSGLSAPILEEKVCDYLMELASVKDVKQTPDELFADPDHDPETCDLDHDHDTPKKKAAAKKKPAAKKAAPKKAAAKKSPAKKKKG